MIITFARNAKSFAIAILVVFFVPPSRCRYWTDFQKFVMNDL